MSDIDDIEDRKVIYIAGPMRGYEFYNFPAFDRAAARFRGQGWDVINPADLDRQIGVDEHTDPLPPDFLRKAMERDLAAVCNADAVALLPGWQNSKGANIEYALAALLELKFYDAITGEPYHENVVDEAKRLVYGDRGQDYGHPLDECGRIAGFWSIVLGTTVQPEHVPLCMIAMKMSRELHRRKRDNAVDICGYAECLDRIHRERERRAVAGAAA